MTLTNSTVARNTAALSGGGLFNNDTMTLLNVTVDSNIAVDNPQIGGNVDGGAGLFSAAGTTNIVNTTFSGNGAGWEGGGILIEPAATVFATNSTFSGNTGDFGGAVFSSGNATLINMTFSGNATYGGGGNINKVGGSLALTNTIVANTKYLANCSPSLGGSLNLSDDGSCGFGSGRDNVNVMLAPLGNYGGPTQTHIPLAGSPAIDFGTGSGCPSTDQRGLPRPVGLACDVGSVERQVLDFPLRFVYLPLVRQ